MSLVGNTFKQITALVLIVLIFTGNGFLLYDKFTDLKTADNEASEAYNLINQVNLLLSSIRSARGNAFGYVQTREEDYLVAYNTGLEQFQKQYSALTKMPGMSNNIKEKIEALGPLVKARIDELERIVQSSSNQSDRVTNQIYLNGFETQTTFTENVNYIADLLAEQLRRRTEHLANIEKDFYSVLLFTIVLSIVSAFLVFFIFRRFYTSNEQDRLEKAKEAAQRGALSRFAQALAGDHSLEEAGERMLASLSAELNIFAAKLFMLDHEKLKQISVYGIDESQKSITVINKSDGLLGAAFQKDEISILDNLPDDYWKVKSSLGESKPQQIVFLPFSFQGWPMGILEIALFTPLKPAQIELLQNSREILGVGINAAKSREDLQLYLEKTQAQAEELQTQQEELRTNNEELEQQARALESNQVSLANSNNELQKAKRNLEEKARELSRSNQYKSEFLAKMSHELRTPLNGLLILSTLLRENKEGNLNDQQIKFANSIHSAGNDLLMLINDILDLSKIEAKKLKMNPEQFRVGDILKSKQATFAQQFASKEIQFEIDVDKDLEDRVMYTDRMRLEQILRNFLSNSLKFTSVGKVTLKARSVDDDQIEFSVHDTGVGIPEAKKKLIFEAFEQADGSVSRQYGGTGLGLSISKELAHLLGGEIYMESIQGEGSTFFLKVPKKFSSADQDINTDEDSSQVNEFETKEVSKSDYKKIRSQLDKIDTDSRSILIVEDDEPFRQSISKIAEDYGFSPIETGTAEEALAVLEEHRPAAILLDIKLPGMSGLGFLENIKRMPLFKHIPVHMISALDKQQSALRMGAMGYLSKPVTSDKVRAAFDRIEGVLKQDLRKILLIEDDDKQRRAIRELVSGDDLEVMSANSGKQALEKLKDTDFDCIILDLTLPDVSGFEVLSEIAELDKSLPPIIIYTGKDLSTEEEDHLRKYSESIIIKGAKSPGRLIDEVNLFLHRVESGEHFNYSQETSESVTNNIDLEGKTILLVDDDLRNTFALTSALEKCGLNIRIAKNGSEALGALEKHSDIDLVLMDIMMPIMDGYEAMRNIRKADRKEVRDLPIIALTAKAMKEDRQKCIEAGANDYLSKPINVKNLINLVKVWLTKDN